MVARCKEGCGRDASHGLIGTKARTHCARCASPSMINLKSPTCAGDECTKRASKAFLGTKIALFCAVHASAGMVDVRSRLCMGSRCKKQPSKVAPGDTVARFCLDHAPEGSVTARKKGKMARKRPGSFAKIAGRAEQDQEHDRRVRAKKRQRIVVGASTAPGEVVLQPSTLLLLMRRADLNKGNLGNFAPISSSSGTCEHGGRAKSLMDKSNDAAFTGSSGGRAPDSRNGVGVAGEGGKDGRTGRPRRTGGGTARRDAAAALLALLPS